MGTNQSRNLQNKPIGSNPRTGALIEFTEAGRVESVYIIGEDENSQIIVENGLAQLTKPGHWSWLKQKIGHKSKSATKK